jgi:hypothetical protein
VEKNSHIIQSTFAILKKLLKLNNCILGENPPNLVTLKKKLIASFFDRRFFGGLHENRKKLNTAALEQGCQMINFHTKKINLGIYWRALE